MSNRQATAKPQLVHSARQMFETRLAKYNDPRNLEWDFDDITDKWERHAFSVFMDLQSTEAERDALLQERDRMREALDRIAEGGHVVSPCATRFARNNDDDDPFDCDCPVSIARAAISGKEGEGDGN
jgi:hypothetical protein